MSHLKNMLPHLIYGFIAVLMVFVIETLVYRHTPQRGSHRVIVSVDDLRSAATAVSPRDHVFEQKAPSPVSVSQGERMTAPWMSYAEVSALHLDAYYQVVIDSNIFRPLLKRASGHGIFPYRLIGSVTKEGETVAYLLDTFKKSVHPVTSGEKLDRFVVENVTSKSVTLRDTKNDDVLTQLELDSIFLK